MISRLLTAVACSLCLAACGGGGDSGDECPSLAGEYSVTTEIVSTTCALGLHTITQPITYTFAQAAPSCDFTMTNSVYPGSTYTGHFTVAGSEAKVTWDSVDPTPSAAGHDLTYTGEDLAITLATSALAGTFDWHSAAGCDGTTNVCSGTVPAGCATPQ
jgi:hypothetical protein